MAITETRPAIEPASEPVEPEPFIGLADHEPGGFAGFLGTGDHKALGVSYVVLSLLFGVGAFVLVTLLRAHLAAEFLPSDSVGQIDTLGQIGLVLLFAIPLFLGVGTYVAPLQVGARTVAFPRAAALGFWGWVVGSGLLIAAYAINGGPDGGRPEAVDLSYAALALVIVSLLIGTISLVTTIFTMRTPGLWMTRIPLFSWSLVVAGSLWLFTLPVLLGNVVLIYLDNHYGGGTSFASGQWGQLWWAFSLPTVYVVAIPVLGAVSDVVATLAGVRQAQRGVMMVAIGAFGVLAFGAWAQTAFAPEIQDQALFVAVGVLIILPVLGVLAGWAVTLRAGSPLAKAALVLALAAAAALLLSTLAGALYAIKPFRLHDAAWLDVGEPPYAVGQMLLVVGAALLGGAAALVHWAPKMFGRFANDALAKLAAAVGLLGVLLAGIPLCVYGFALKITSLADADSFLNGVSAVGAGLVVVSLLLLVGALLGARSGEQADADAWGRGQTLEWMVPSPPPAVDFEAALERVESAEPLLDATATDEASR